MMSTQNQIRYRKIAPRIWADEKFRALSRPNPNAQTLFIYLLTGPHTTSLPGLFCIGEAALAELLEWPLEAFREAFTEVLKTGMVKADWKARVVFIPNAINYNIPESPNVVKGWRNHWNEIPDCALKREARAHFQKFLNEYSKPFVEAFATCLKPFAKASPNQEQEQEPEQEQEQEQKQEQKPDSERERAIIAPNDSAASAGVLLWSDVYRKINGTPSPGTHDPATAAIIEKLLEKHGVELLRCAFEQFLRSADVKIRTLQVFASASMCEDYIGRAGKLLAKRKGEHATHQPLPTRPERALLPPGFAWKLWCELCEKHPKFEKELPPLGISNFEYFYREHIADFEIALRNYVADSKAKGGPGIFQLNFSKYVRTSPRENTMPGAQP